MNAISWSVARALYYIHGRLNMTMMHLFLFLLTEFAYGRHNTIISNFWCPKAVEIKFPPLKLFKFSRVRFYKYFRTIMRFSKAIFQLLCSVLNRPNYAPSGGARRRLMNSGRRAMATVSTTTARLHTVWPVHKPSLGWHTPSYAK